jgi:hypothetical protein
LEFVALLEMRSVQSQKICLFAKRVDLKELPESVWVKGLSLAAEKIHQGGLSQGLTEMMPLRPTSPIEAKMGILDGQDRW